eukprot:CAMPEP_0194443114 /NCGR_PEP_ID=MMETSP0176-20130528/126522_1 /TAXON_ID=216777 /ORGANISM="Proboscia alata, Strain PI-D3" /LENGTH=673 /DNA_ID=CAMNT_0039269323 /DNA_START=162 /DNA_END=2184 /DNA_ORIENTATION=-
MSLLQRTRACVLLLLILVGVALVECRKSSPSYNSRGSGNPGKNRRPPPQNNRPPPSRRRSTMDEDDSQDDFDETDMEQNNRPPPSRRRSTMDEDDSQDDFDETDMEDDWEDDGYDEEEEVIRPISKKRSSPPPRQKQSRRAPPAHDDQYDSEDEDQYDQDEDDYDYPEPQSRRPSHRDPPSRGRRGPLPRGGRGQRGGRGRGRQESTVVPYINKAQSAFTRGLTTVRNSIPDPATIASTTKSALATARSTTTHVTKTISREFKGLTSSELEQVMLKATRPDDTPVKGKHVERLVGVTYQVSGRFDLYSSVLRKLWKKMLEDDWRTKIKSLYVLHRFSSDGAPDHQQNLKLRLRELRRSRDPKTKEKYFNTKLFLKGTVTADNKAFRDFLARYAHYVFLRVQTFSGMFIEIAPPDTPPQRNERPSKSKSPQRPTPPTPPSSPLPSRQVLEGAKLLCQSASQACVLKDGEVCENTAIAVERIAADMIGLTTAVAVSLNRCLKPKHRYCRGTHRRRYDRFDHRRGRFPQPVFETKTAQSTTEQLISSAETGRGPGEGMVRVLQRGIAATDADAGETVHTAAGCVRIVPTGEDGEQREKDLLQKGLSYGDDDEPAEEEKEEEEKEDVAEDKEEEKPPAASASSEKADEEEEEEEAEEEDEYEEYDFEDGDEYYDEEE